MTVQWSTTLRNGRLNAWEAAIGVDGHLRVYAGAIPAHCADSIGAATLLAEFDLPSGWCGAAANGAISMEGLPLQTTAIAGGTGTDATFYRIYASDATCHEQGTVSQTGGGGDLIIDNLSIAIGQIVEITAFTKTEPGA